MRLIVFLFIVLQFASCSPGIKTDEKLVKKIITTTEYQILNNDFNSPDTIHQHKEVIKYDTDNNMLENMEYWRETSTFGGGGIYKYDKANRLIEEYHLDNNNRLSATYFYEYSRDTAIQFVVYANGEKFMRKINQYDKKKNLVRETAFDNTGIIMYDFHYKYNAANQEIERYGTINNKRVQTNYKMYDSLSNLIEQKSVDSNGIILSVEKFIYERFDRNGNWEVRKSILSGVPHSIAFRKVEVK